MAERRMFAKTIVDSDAFLDMPLSSQALYFHLSMRADDDGFVNNPKKIQRMIGCSDDDLKLLIAKRFVLIFDSGVIVIKHWRLHNTLRKDRYKPTIYQEEFKKLILKSDGGYTDRLPSGWQVVAKRLPSGCQADDKEETAKNADSNEINELDDGCQTGNQVATQDRLGKDRLIINTNQKQTEVCNEGHAREDDVCCVSSCEDNFSEDEVIDAPVKVQIEHAQLQNLDKIEDEKKPLTLVELITACKTFGIRLSHTPKTEAIANRKTITLAVLRECVKAWKGINTGTGYFIGILENASKDPNSILPHDKREKPELSAETITDKQAGYFASRLVKDVSFQSTFGVGHSSFDTFIAQVTQRLHDPEYFKEYMPWMQKLGFMSTKREAA